MRTPGGAKSFVGMVGLLFFISILMHSQAATLIRLAAAPSLAICFWRLLMAAILLLPLACRPSHARGLRQMERSDWIQLLLSGFFLFTHFYFFFRSVQETTVANATILLSLSPVTTAIGAYWLFGERVTLHLALACALGFAGVGVIFGASALTHGASMQGDVWGVLSAVCFSGYILTGKRVRMRVVNSLYSFAIYLQTALYASIAMTVWNVPFTGYPERSWWALAGLAIFPTILGHSLFTYCLNYMNVNFMSCMTLVEPVLAAAFAWWLFDEPLTEWAALGFALTCAAVVALYWETLVGAFRQTAQKAAS